MAKASTVWGIDVGQCALKAVKLHRVGEDVTVEAFDIIEHEKILSQPDADRPALIRSALEQFLTRNNVKNSQVVVSMPGLTSFPCYVKLPPVETKKVPDIVRFEAQQQIPLPLEEVVWQWQAFREADSPDIEVGIFAVRRSDITSMLEQFASVALSVDAVQMAPLALYNFMEFDGQRAEDGATLLIDVGADKTDLVVADKNRLWTRTIRIGGNNFTEALVRAFKLSFGKAEKLKRTAATSKYARQIFQAMRPIFADLVQEIQRSLGFYTALHRDTKLKKILALGNGFRLPGFQKYLEQNLNITVIRLDGYSRLKTAGAADTPVFTENIMSFAVAYGLAVQGMGAATVQTNLLPTEISRKRRWSTKRPWFAAAAAVLVAALALVPWRTSADKSDLTPGPAFDEAAAIAKTLEDLTQEKSQYANQGKSEEEAVNRQYELYGYRNLVPAVLNLVDKSLFRSALDQPVFGAVRGETEANRRDVIRRVLAKKRSERRMVVKEVLEMTYMPDIRKEMPTDKAGNDPIRGWKVYLRGRTPLGLNDTANRIVAPIKRESNALALEPMDGTPSPIKLLYMPPEKITPGVPAAALSPDPAARANTADALMAWGVSTDANVVLDPAEDIATDTKFEIVWILSIEGDGLVKLNPPPPPTAEAKNP